MLAEICGRVCLHPSVEYTQCWMTILVKYIILYLKEHLMRITNLVLRTLSDVVLMSNDVIKLTSFVISCIFVRKNHLKSPFDDKNYILRTLLVVVLMS